MTAHSSQRGPLTQQGWTVHRVAAESLVVLCHEAHHVDNGGRRLTRRTVGRAGQGHRPRCGPLRRRVGSVDRTPGEEVLQNPRRVGSTIHARRTVATA